MLYLNNLEATPIGITIPVMVETRLHSVKLRQRENSTLGEQWQNSTTHSGHMNRV